MKFLCLLLFSFSLFTGNKGLDCAPELQTTLAIVKQIPGADAVLANVLKEGHINIRVNDYLPSRFEGYWNPDNRTVYVTKLDGTSKEVLIVTLLFELHNALRNNDLSKLDHLAQTGQISRKRYIEAVERIEYQNACATSALLEKGIEKKIISKRCHWPLSSSFKAHFAYQKTCGHSVWIGEMYDDLSRQHQVS